MTFPRTPLFIFVAAGLTVPACGSSSDSKPSGASDGGAGSSGGATGGSSSGAESTSGAPSGGVSGASSGSGAASGASPSSGSAVSSGASSTAGSSSGSGSTVGADGGAFHGGNPKSSCSMAIPADGQAADTSHAVVVGSGTAASCTFSALEAAVAKGGAITFNCGSAPVSIVVTATLNVPTTTNTTIDGGNLVTLDGGGAVQILSFNSANWQNNENRLTLQHLALVNGKTTPKQAIPTAPAPCSQGFDDGQGGAVYMRDGNLTVVDCVFTNNQAALLGPDTGGGAIYVQGSKHGMVIVSSTFTNNKAANGGAIGGLFCEEDIYNTLVTNNTATGNGANNNDASKCSAMNNGQNEIGSGGNGGGVYSDGNSVNILLCGDDIEQNTAGMGGFGGGLFFTSNNMAGTLTIADTTMTSNPGGHWTNVSTGSIKSAGSDVGTNCKSISVTNSTLEGYP